MAAYLDLADYLLIAEAVLGVAAEKIARWPRIGLAESALHAPAAGYAGVEVYPDMVDKAAVFAFVWRGTTRCRTETSVSRTWRRSSSWLATGSSGSRRRSTRRWHDRGGRSRAAL